MNWLLGGVLIIAGLVIVASGAMASRGRLTRQWWVGIRTSTTMASDATWDAAHRAGGTWILAGGVVMTLGGLLVLLAEDEDTAAWIALGATLVGLIPILIGGFKGQSAARSTLGTGA